jgi:hypothetical protein
LIDGIKLNCCNSDFREWENHPDLDFTLPVSAKTGEVLPESRRAKFNEMLFRITPSRKTPGAMWCYLEGSVHRYANGGAANADQFRFTSFCKTVKELCSRFNIDPERSTLENVEFGINIVLPITASEYIKTLVCHGDRPFAELSRDKKNLGKIVERQQYTFKLYDKGKQAETGQANILRVEIHVSRMEFLKEYGISTLADLTDRAKIAPLGQLLGDVFADVIAYDGSIKESSLSEKECYTLKDFSNPKWWNDLDKRRRYYYRQVFAKMMQKYGANPLHLSVVFEAKKQWSEMLENDAHNLDFLTGLNTQHHADNLDFLTVRMNGYLVQLDNNIIYKHKQVECFNILPETPPENTPQLSVKITIFCASCGRDIRGQKPGSKYCSKNLFGPGARKCRDKAYNKKRKPRRELETALLDTLAPMLPGLVLTMTVFVNKTTPEKRREMCAVTNWTKEATKGQPLEAVVTRAARATITTTEGKTHSFTWSRAKSLIWLMTEKPPSTNPVTKQDTFNKNNKFKK